MRRWFFALFLLLAHAARAQEFPPIVAIDFSGNDTTADHVMRRELLIKPGDPADPEAIERGRQAIQDLGLFKGVSVHTETTLRQAQGDRGGVRVVYIVKEKYYLLAYPRLSGNADLQYGYGAEVRWNNIAGQNQNFRMLWSRSNQKKEGYGVKTSYLAAYDIPFIADSRYSLSLSASHTLAPVTGDPSYNESFDLGQILVTRSFPRGALSQGWSISGGVLWQNEDRWGPQAPAPYGMATALVAATSFRDVRFNIYSEEGQSYGVRAEWALKDAGSDYNYSSLVGGWQRYLHVGEKPHQSLYLFADAGGFFNGPGDVHHFNLGGSSALHGYRRYAYEGDLYYHLEAVFLRPVGWDWFRPEIVVETGNVFDEARDFNLRTVHTSIGVGARLRLSWFVNFELEAGVAIPASGGKVRFFGGKV